MTAFSFKSYAARDRVAGDTTPLITIKDGHPLNNAHRAPFSSGQAAARALLVHAQRQLSDPERGQAYFGKLLGEVERSTTTSKDLQKRLRDRQVRATIALSNSDVDLSTDQLQIVADLAVVQSQILERLAPGVDNSDPSNPRLVDPIEQLDSITRSALQNAALMRVQREQGAEVSQVLDWQQALLTHMAETPGIDHSDDAQVVANYDRLIFQLEETIPQAVERDEPLWEVDETLDPHAVAITRDRLVAALGKDFDPKNSEQGAELDQQARSAVYRSMSMEERQFAATMIALSTSDRVEVGMQLVNSTLPEVRIPALDSANARFDVRMATEEEARVMDRLLRYAAETRVYPGPDIAGQNVESMKELAVAAGEQGRFTLALAVANDPVSIEHASVLLRDTAGNPDIRVLVHADVASVRDQLEAVRRDALVAAGRDPKISDASDATRALGGWSLPDNGADRIIGTGPNDIAIFIANADQVIAYTNRIDLDLGNVNDAARALQSAQAQLASADDKLAAAASAFYDTCNPELVDKAQALTESHADRAAVDAAYAAMVASGDKRLKADFDGAKLIREKAMEAASAADRHLRTLERQLLEDRVRITPPGDLARAAIVDLAQQQGKLHKVYEAGTGAEIRNYQAQLKAQRLRNGSTNEPSSLRRLFHSTRGVNAVLVDGSNWFNPTKGSAKGMEALLERVSGLPKTATIITGNQKRNPISAEMFKGFPEANVIHATAWRVTERSTPTDMDGRTVTLSARSTKLDLGLVEDKNSLSGARERDWSYNDLKGKLVIVTGGGSMSAETFDAIRELAVKRGLTGDALSPKEVADAYAHLASNGQAHLEAPKFANDRLARAIMQEAMVDYSSQAILGTDMGADYHSANLIRQAVDTDKLAVAIGKDGNPVPVQAAYDHSLQYAKSVADNTLDGVKAELNLAASSDFGQAVLSRMPGVDATQAKALGESFNTLSDVMQAAAANEITEALPAALHHELSRPTNWSNAIKRVDEIAAEVDKAGLSPIASTDPRFPKTLLEVGKHDMLFVAGNADLNKPTVALVVGGDTSPSKADIDAARNVAREAAEKGWAVSVHLSGETSAKIATALAGMPEGERPALLLIGDGHPNSATNSQTREAIGTVRDAGGAFVTPVAPVIDASKDTREPTYVENRRSALDLQGRQATAMVVLKSSGNDVELLAVRAALGADRPIAAVGPSDLKNPSVDDLRFRTADYSANRRLLAGGGRVDVMLEARSLAFKPNFIPDMTAQTAEGYVMFEGSTAGRMSDDGRGEKARFDNNNVELGGRMSASIEWKDRAEYLAGGTGTAEFLGKVETNEARKIQATEADRAEKARQNDARFLDVASRYTPSRADIAQDLQAHNDTAQENANLATIQYMQQQRAAGRGR